MSKTPAYPTGYARYTRRWWLQNLRTFFWVALVTVLVWIYADIEFTDTMELRAVVLLNTGKSDDLDIVGRPDTEVTFVVRGSRGKLEEFRRKLLEKRRVIRFDVSEKYGAGEHQIPVVEVLNRSEHLQREGIAVQSTSPRAIQVQIDQRVSRKLPVAFQSTGASLVEGSEKIEPREVTVSAAKRVWEVIDKRIGQADQEIQTQQVDLSGLDPGNETVTAPLRTWLANEPVAVDPETVQVALEIESKQETRDFDVMVQVQSPRIWYEKGGTWEQYRLERSPTSVWNPTVKITGTAEALDALQADGLLNAYVTVGDKHLAPTESWYSEDVYYHLPDNLDVERVPGQVIQVQFRLVRTSPPPG
jgi:hypothetical protein